MCRPLDLMEFHLNNGQTSAVRIRHGLGGDTVGLPKSARMYKGCTRDVQGMYKGCTRDVQGMYKGCTRDVQGMYKGYLRATQGNNIVTTPPQPHSNSRAPRQGQ